jgi:hypothetical protein
MSERKPQLGGGGGARVQAGCAVQRGVIAGRAGQHP